MLPIKPPQRGGTRQHSVPCAALRFSAQSTGRNVRDIQIPHIRGKVLIIEVDSLHISSPVCEAPSSENNCRHHAHVCARGVLLRAPVRPARVRHHGRDRPHELRVPLPGVRLHRQSATWRRLLGLQTRSTVSAWSGSGSSSVSFLSFS